MKVYNDAQMPRIIRVHCFVMMRPQGRWKEGLFIFREWESTTYYFRGAGEQAHTLGYLGSTAKKWKISGFHFV